MVNKFKFRESLCVLMVLLPCFMQISCGDDNADPVLYDVSPINFVIEITDGEGNNLLNPEYEGNILDLGIVMDYDGKSYPVDVNTQTNYPHLKASRYYLPEFYGLQAYHQIAGESINRWVLSFGEFEAQTQCAEYDCTLRLENLGLSYDLKAVATFQDGISNRKFYLDGQLLDGTNVYHIIIDNSSLSGD